jgi:hypothetical protein
VLRYVRRQSIRAIVNFKVQAQRKRWLKGQAFLVDHIRFEVHACDLRMGGKTNRKCVKGMLGNREGIETTSELTCL